MTDLFKQYHPVKATAALVCMLLFLACLALYGRASFRGAAISGPVHIAANAAHVAVTLNNEILLLDTDGALQEHRALEALGIPSHPIDLRWRNDSTLLVATQGPSGLYVCDYPTWQCSSLRSPLFAHLRGQIKVLPESSGAGLLISDTVGGRL